MTTSELLAQLPPIPSDDLLPSIHQALESSERSIIVLDEDASGTQNVFDVPILTQLDADSIREAIDQAPPLLFLLSNSRFLSPEERSAHHHQLASILKEYRDEIILIARSDFSSLFTSPSHFFSESQTLKEALDIPHAPTLLVPFCQDSGQITIENTHYRIEGENATPLGHLSELSPEETLHSLSLTDLRQVKHPDEPQSSEPTSLLLAKLSALPPSSTCIINATTPRDLASLSLALHQSERRFLIRSAASFVQSLAGITSRPALAPWQMQDLEPNPNGGLILISSHCQKTSEQVQHLLKNGSALTALKLSIPDLLNGTFNLPSTVHSVDSGLRSGQSVVLFTSRVDEDHSAQPMILKHISQAFISIVKAIEARPRFIIAKGSSTATEIAISALGVKQAQVLGQILPGVPVWTLGNESAHPGLAYLIFPDKAGQASSLTEAQQKLSS